MLGDFRCALFFFFNDTATTEIYTLSLHDALPISCFVSAAIRMVHTSAGPRPIIFIAPTISALLTVMAVSDRKSTRLNSSHGYISYAVFCLKKKKSNYSVTLARPVLDFACLRPGRI